MPCTDQVDVHVATNLATKSVQAIKRSTVTRNALPFIIHATIALMTQGSPLKWK